MMKRKKNKVISYIGNENEEKKNIKFKYLSLKHLFKNTRNSTTDFSTNDSNTLNTITNTYNTISNTFHTINNEEISFKTEVKIPYQSKIQFAEKPKLQTENTEIIKHRKIIKSPTQRKKQHSTTGIFTTKQLNKQKKTIESESKKPKRNKDFLHIKSKQEYIQEEENKKLEINKQIKINFFKALENEKKNLIKNLKQSHKKLKNQISKTITTTLTENITLTKKIRPLHLTEYLKFYQEKLNSKKIKLYDIIEKEKIEEVERIQKINEHRIKNEKKKILYKKVQIIIFTLAAHLTRNKINLSDFLLMNTQSINKLSFYKEDFKILKNAIKDNDEKKVKFLIEKNKFLCQMYDDFNQTALHIASKRKRKEIIKIILENGAKIDFKDFVGRTALHYACLYNNLENVEILLFEFASPLIKDHYNKLPEDYSNDELIKFFILRAKNLIDINFKRINFKESLKAIRNGLEFFFNIPEETLRKML